MSHASLYTEQYFESRPGHRRRRSADIPWTEALPCQWRELVCAPLYFDHYLDYQLAAERILGRDQEDETCFCAHSVILEEEGYREFLRAWRLRDGRWLIHRIVVRNGRADKARGFYSLGEAMPG